MAVKTAPSMIATTMIHTTTIAMTTIAMPRTVPVDTALL